MKHTTSKTIQFLSLAGLLALAAPIYAQSEIRVPWQDICKAAAGRGLAIETADGHMTSGFCVAIDVNEIAVQTNQRRVVRIARGTLSRIELIRPFDDSHRLRSLGRNMHHSLHQGFAWILSPLAPLGIVTIPATLAWGAVSAPFCILGDLTQPPTPVVEIKVI